MVPPRELYSESQSIMHLKPSKTIKASYTAFTYPTLSLSRRSSFAQHEASTPPRLWENGWVEVHLPDSYVYYVNPTARIVADVEMWNDELFNAVSKHLELEQHKNVLESVRKGAVLWLRDAGSVREDPPAAENAPRPMLLPGDTLHPVQVQSSPQPTPLMLFSPF